MDISESKFFCAGHELTFTVLSDVPCRARYVDSVPLPLTQEYVATYQMEPAVDSQWVLVEQRDGDKVVERFFVRKGNLFPETDPRCLPEEFRKSLAQQLAKRRVADQSSSRKDGWRRAP